MKWENTIHTENNNSLYARWHESVVNNIITKQTADWNDECVSQ